MTAGYTLDKAERTYLLNRLQSASDLCGFERDLLTKLEASRCAPCRGTGYAPYVGGENDETPCRTCGGTGFAPHASDPDDASHD